MQYNYKYSQRAYWFQCGKFTKYWTTLSARHYHQQHIFQLALPVA
jgi:hypothetical protein